MGFRGTAGQGRGARGARDASAGPSWDLLVSPPDPAAKNGGSSQVAASAAWHSPASPSPAIGANCGI